jgi:hypothetical protein
MYCLMFLRLVCGSASLECLHSDHVWMVAGTDMCKCKARSGVDSVREVRSHTVCMKTGMGTFALWF